MDPQVVAAIHLAMADKANQSGGVIQPPTKKGVVVVTHPSVKHD